MTNLRKGRGTMPRRLLAAAAVAMLLGACNSSAVDDLVDVDNPDEISENAVNTPAGATALYNAGIADFAAAFSGDNGGTEGVSLIGGMMADEWQHSGTFSTRRSYDQRQETPDNGTIGGTNRRVHRSRLNALSAKLALLASGSVATGDSRVPEMVALEGLAYVFMGETWCSGQPFSSFVDVPGQRTIIDAPPLTTAQVWTEAITRFDEAIAGAAGAGNAIRNLALISKARTLVNQSRSNLAAAAALVAGIPTTYVYFARHSVNGPRNGIFVFNQTSERFSLAHNEGINGLPFRGAGAGTDSLQADPRVPFRRIPGNDVGFDNVTPQYDYRGFTTDLGDDDAIVTSGVEARLIEAEADLQAGNVAGWLSKLNALRTGPSPVNSKTGGGAGFITGMPALVDPGTAAGREDLHFRERAFWLFATAHRIGDLRRMIRQYGRGSETVFPTGNYFKGGLYGPDVNFPGAQAEDPNSLATGLNTRRCLSDAA